MGRLETRNGRAAVGFALLHAVTITMVNVCAGAGHISEDHQTLEVNYDTPRSSRQ